MDGARRRDVAAFVLIERRAPSPLVGLALLRRAPMIRADPDPHRAAFALAHGTLTIAATDGVPDREQGLAGGLLHTSTQFGSAVGISAVTAV
ncbi:hypothetical protein ACIQWV_04550 [Streptomyces sp. NPDC098085]|uniref:hypothetical protein n=1 Tax=Streptomyces sp. NPDC098085 TaxID=3366094 RepID=UPI0037FA190D